MFRTTFNLESFRNKSTPFSGLFTPWWRVVQFTPSGWERCITGPLCTGSGPPAASARSASCFDTHNGDAPLEADFIGWD
jgi:hypothetical protein